MEYVAGMAIVKTIGIDGTLMCINTLTSTTSNIYSLIRKFHASEETPNITLYIKETDLEQKLQLLECIIKSIDINRHHTDALSISINNLKHCISDMDAVLKETDKRLEYNKTVWVLKSIRNYGFTDMYEKLKLHSRTLDERKKALLEVLSINVYLTPTVGA
jgi:hypothetical protein